ncbi:hypothetical protein WICPIJ_004933 [Wickerhamomyces pijperi]|uniref:Uncharacterized protein n=1 Tax=Wickerhamomyces pijperi TaxID=599730 RepID=A0A9P8TLK8_WICPI|nr:hypothetical protein WICPIJ_004933 [Wickerhamomyces pijperi]
MMSSSSSSLIERKALLPILMNGKMSNLPSSILHWSKLNKEMNAVICKRKLTTTAPAEYNAKFLTAGISTKEARPKAKNWEEADNRIEGPILPTALEILTWINSLGKAVLTTFNSWVIRKMLSTPTAKIKNGITSAMISVDLTPKNDQTPAEDVTDSKTITIPDKPRQKRVLRKCNEPPRAKEA